jgi:hypothetical protein
VGISFSLPGAGLHVVDASKQLYRPVTVRAARRSTRVAPVLVPAPAPREALLSEVEQSA